MDVGQKMLTEDGMSGTQSAEPRSITERDVAVLWSEVLQTTKQPISTDDFFALGGDSMMMVMLELRVKEEFSVELPVGAVLKAPTLHDFSNLVNASRSRSPRYARCRED